ncbi:MAG: hypothetical protein J2P36_21755, partial [Ktedonobacteraceae bacterium]|nr:hypothetical protein [Ktedonobacteraceae bacterium]
MAVIKCIYDVAKRFIVRSKWFLLLPVLCAVVIANVLIFALPDSAQAAPIHQAASSTSTQPHDPCAPGFTPVPSGNNSFKCVPIERHACVGDQTPETDPGCFLPDATNCADGAPMRD